MHLPSIFRNGIFAILILKCLPLTKNFLVFIDMILQAFSKSVYGADLRDQDIFHAVCFY